MSAEQVDNRSIFYTPEELIAAVRRPDLPIFISGYEADSNGNVFYTGGPEYINGRIEDTLKAIGRAAITIPEFSSTEPGTFSVTITPITLRRFVQTGVHHRIIPEVHYIGPQENPSMDENDQPKGPKIKKAKVRLFDNEADIFLTFLNPETKRKRIPERYKGSGEIVEVEL